MSMSEPGVKHDQGKLQYRLMPVVVLREIVKVLTFGAQKYAPDNWRKVENRRERYTDALFRHIEAWRAGERQDPESGCHHLAHAACCLVFLMTEELEGARTFNPPEMK